MKDNIQTINILPYIASEEDKKLDVLLIFNSVSFSSVTDVRVPFSPFVSYTLVFFVGLTRL